MMHGKGIGGVFAAIAAGAGRAALCAAAVSFGPAFLLGGEPPGPAAAETEAPPPAPVFVEDASLLAAYADPAGRFVSGRAAVSLFLGVFSAASGGSELDGSLQADVLFAYRLRLGSLFAFDREGRFYFAVSPRLSVGVKPDTGKVETVNGRLSFSDILRGVSLSAYLKLP